MHLPNGSKIFIEASNEREYDFKLLDTTDVGIPNTYVLVLNQAAGVSAFGVGDIVVITECDNKLIEGNVYSIRSVNGDVSRVRVWPEYRANDLPVGNNISSPGKVRRISSWAELPCVQSIDKEGNEQNWYTYQCLSSGREERQKTTKSALFMSYVMAHDPDNPTYAVMREKEASKRLMAMRMHIPRAKENRYCAGNVSFDDIPSTAVNEMETVTLRMAIRGSYNFLPSS
ncbi:putative tail depolymerase [Klebsiella phage PWKp19]|nr:putative tail depolymerase [Klebsiella phage PWKp19]